FTVEANSTTGQTSSNTADVNPADTDTNQGLILTVTPVVADFIEGSTSTGDTVATSEATDPDGGDIVYSIDDETNYQINPTTGEVTLTDAGATIVNGGGVLPVFTVEANSTTGQTSSNTADVNPADTDGNEAPVLSIDSIYNFIEDDGVLVGNVVATFSTSDVENDSLTITLSDTTNYILGTGVNDGKVLLTENGLALVNAGTDLPAFTLIANDGKTDSNTGNVDPSVTPVDDPTITSADVNNVNEDTTLTVDVAKGVLSNDFDADDTLTILSFEIAGNSHAVGSTVSLTEGEFTLNIDGSYQFIPATNYSGDVPVITYTTNTDVTSSLTITVTPVADAIAPETISIVIGEEIPYTVTGDGATVIDGNHMTLADGTEVIASGEINLSNGLGIGVDGNTGSEDANRIDVGETLEFTFPVNMQGMLLGVKNSADDIISITSENIDVDISASNMIMVSGTLGGGKFSDTSSVMMTVYGLDEDGESVEIIVSSSSFTLNADGVYEWGLSYDASKLISIDSVDLTWLIDGSIISNGGGEIALYVDADMENMIFSNAGDSGKNGANGYQIDNISFAVGDQTSHTYPVDISAVLTDADNSESFTDIYLSGFPTGSTMSVVDADGIETQIIPTQNANGDDVFTLDTALLGNGNISDKIFLTTPDPLETDFSPTIAVTTTDSYTDGNGDVVTDSAYTILGGSDSSSFTGSDGNDYIDGGLGDDTLIGGLGDDLLIGGSGLDTFVWLESDNGIDHIQDFNKLEDTIDLSDLLHIEAGDNLNYFLDFDSDGTDTVISIRADGVGSEITQTIVLDGVNLVGDDVVIINDLFEEDNSGPLIISDDSSVNESVIIATVPEDAI
ncbi:MAG: type I secretion C-terminal target domain-containing protein, partial [Psychromonas sp.]